MHHARLGNREVGNAFSAWRMHLERHGLVFAVGVFSKQLDDGSWRKHGFTRLGIGLLYAYGRVDAMVLNRHEHDVRVGMHFNIGDWIDESERLIGAIRFNNGVGSIGQGATRRRLFAMGFRLPAFKQILRSEAPVTFRCDGSHERAEKRRSAVRDDGLSLRVKNWRNVVALARKASIVLQPYFEFRSFEGRFQ